MAGRLKVAMITGTMVLATMGVGEAWAAERSWMVGGFETISVAGPYEVAVAVGPGQSVRAQGAQRDLDQLDVRVSNRGLIVEPKEKRWDFSDNEPVRIRVTVPSLRAVSLAGSGNMTIDKVRTTNFSGSTAGSGNLRIDSLDAETAKLSVAGSGDVAVAGRCRTATLSIAGSGDMQVGSLKCQTLTGTIAGSGTINANASRTAKLSVIGSGDVIVAGGAKCSVTKMGSGSVHCGS